VALKQQIKIGHHRQGEMTPKSISQSTGVAGNRVEREQGDTFARSEKTPWRRRWCWLQSRTDNTAAVACSSSGACEGRARGETGSASS
jgi:hypothetical protein